MRIDEAAIFGHCADTVSVAIGDETRVAFVLDDRFLGESYVRLDGLGVDPRK